MAKTVFLQIRITPADRERLKTAAARDYLDLSTWARRVLLSTLDAMEEQADARTNDRRETRSGSSGSASSKKKKRR